MVAGLFTLVALLTGVIGYLRASDAPISLDFAILHTKDGGRSSGFLLAQSGDALLLAPAVENYTIGRVAAIPKADVVDLRISRGPEDGVRPLRRDVEVRRRVAMYDTLPAPPGRDQTLKTQLFLADVRGSTLWKYPPIMLPASIRRVAAQLRRVRGDQRGPVERRGRARVARGAQRGAEPVRGAGRDHARPVGRPSRGTLPATRQSRAASSSSNRTTSAASGPYAPWPARSTENCGPATR